MATVEEKAADLLRGPIESMGCVLWGIQFLHAGRHSTLRVYIDRDGGVTVDDCAEVSEQIGRILDVEEVIPYEYRLEVSSPGMDRLFFTFEQLASAAGSEISFEFQREINGSRKFKAVLKSAEDGAEGKRLVLTLEDGTEVPCAYADVKSARLVPHF